MNVCMDHVQSSRIASQDEHSYTEAREGKSSVFVNKRIGIVFAVQWLGTHMVSAARFVAKKLKEFTIAIFLVLPPMVGDATAGLGLGAGIVGLIGVTNPAFAATAGAVQLAHVLMVAGGVGGLLRGYERGMTALDNYYNTTNAQTQTQIIRMVERGESKRKARVNKAFKQLNKKRRIRREVHKALNEANRQAVAVQSVKPAEALVNKAVKIAVPALAASAG